MSKVWKTIEFITALPDSELGAWRCVTRGSSASQALKVHKGPALFCERCGDMPALAISLGNSDTKFCRACFREEHKDSDFSKDE